MTLNEGSFFFFFLFFFFGREGGGFLFVCGGVWVGMSDVFVVQQHLPRNLGVAERVRHAVYQA